MSKFISYQPANDLIERHDTAKEAKEAAEYYIQQYRDDAITGWDMEVEQVFWAEIKGTARQISYGQDEIDYALDNKSDSVEHCIAPEANVYYRMVRKNGYKKQIKKMFEEMGELSVELIGYMSGEANYDEVRSEIADVENMLIQMRIIFDPENLIPGIMAEKMKKAEAGNECPGNCADCENAKCLDL